MSVWYLEPKLIKRKLAGNEVIILGGSTVKRFHRPGGCDIGRIEPVTQDGLDDAIFVTIEHTAACLGFTECKACVKALALKAHEIAVHEALDEFMDDDFSEDDAREFIQKLEGKGYTVVKR